LIMVIGLLVDDAIIMAENIFRHMEKGVDPHEAAIKGGEEVMRPVTASILTTLCAYFPLMLMSGIIGKFVQVIPIVVCIALTLSWINTLIAVPTHAAEFTILARNRWTIRDKHWFDPIRENYLKTLRFVIDWRYLFTAGMIIFFAITMFVAIVHVKFVLFTSEGMDEFFVRAEVPMGTKLEDTSRLMEPIEKRIMRLPSSELQNIITEIGVKQDDSMTGEASAERGTHLAQIRVLLTPTSMRDRDGKLIIKEIEESLASFKGFEKLYVDDVRPGPPVGKAVEIRLRGNDFETLKAATQEFKDYLGRIEGVTDIRDDLSQGKDELEVVIDRELAARALLSFEDIARDVRNAFEGGIATTIQKSDEEINIRVKFPEDYKFSQDSLNLVLIANSRGNLIPLKELATFKRTPGLVSIKRFDRKRLITVTADVDEIYATSMEVTRDLKKDFADLGRRYYGVNMVLGGEAKRTAESMQSLGRAFVLALMMIFFIIAVQFRSLVQPLVVMLTIPLGIVGVVWALFFHGKSLGFMSMMGLIGLTGVVVNDSIILIDFMNRLRREGMKRKDSIMEACRTRFRAVILASFTTVLGTLPMAYGWGGDDPFVRPMALAFSWGLAFSTTITLFAIPCAYSIVDDISMKLLHRSTVKPLVAHT